MKKLPKFMMLIFLMTGYIASAQTVVINPASPFVVPAGVTSIKVEVWGGGGGGGGSQNTLLTNRFGGGGGGGGFSTATFATTGGDSYSIVIGAGGTVAANANGGTGGTSTVSGPGGSVSASGGGGGVKSTAATGGTGGTGTTFNGGAGGTGSGNGAGGGGGAGNAASGTAGANAATGVGGAGLPNVSPYVGGAGGAFRTTNGNGNAGVTPAGGGGGGRSNTATSSGGLGGAGQVVITFTCPVYTLTSTTVVSPICVASAASVTLNSGTFPDGTYTVTYNTSAPNLATGLTVSATFISGTTTFNTGTLANAGNTTITITNIGISGGCSSSIGSNNSATVTVNAAATAAAGTSVTTCSNAGAVNITAGSSATNNSGVQWASSGTGTFTNDNSLTLATYTPSSADITAGVVTLTLTSFGNAPCSNATSNKTLTINPAPTVTPAAFCQGGSGTLSASVSCPNLNSSATGTNSSTFTLTNTSPVHNITLPVSGVPSGATITDVNVSITIAHNYQSDVVLSLRAADGTTTVSLTGPSGAGGSNNLGNTTGTITETSTGAVVVYTFDQAAATQAWGSSNPATAGSFRPAAAGGNMNTFNGLSVINGNWTLIADDDASGDNGLITAVSVSIQYTKVGALAWYTVPTGGNAVQTGAPFNPVGDAEVIAEGGAYANLTNSNTPGTYTFYAACNITDCREAVTFVIDQAATVDAGADVSLCNPVTYTLNGARGGSATSSVWTTSGDGLFNDNTQLGAVYTFGANDLATGNVALTLTTNDPAGTCGAVADNLNIVIRTAIPAAPVTGTGPSSVCPPLNNVTLFVTPVSDADSYNWIPGPTTTGVTFNGSTTGSSVSVNYGTTVNSTYGIRAYSVNSCGTSLGYYAVFARRAVGAPQFPSGATIACANDIKTYTIPAVTGAETYTWSGPAGSLIDGNPTPYTAAGLTTVNVTFPAGFTSGQVGVAANVACFTTVTKNTNVSTATVSVGLITGSTYTVCPGSSYTYSVVPVAGAVGYNWVLPANVTGSSSSNSIVVTIQPGFASANIKVSANSVCGVASAQQQRTITTGVAPRPASITGPVNGMCGQTVVYSCPSQAGVTYNWTVPGTATINSGQGTNAISVTHGTFSIGSVCVTATNACGTSPSRCITVNGAPATPASITANPSSWCDNTAGVEFTANVANVTGAYTLSWMYPGATVCTYVLGGGNSTTLILDWITGGGNVIVTASNACGNGSRILNAASTCREGFNEGVVEENNLSLSPNPARSYINVNYNVTQAGVSKVMVTDVSGRTLVSNHVTSQIGTNNTQIDVRTLAKGIYIVSLHADGKITQSRIAVE